MTTLKRVLPGRVAGSLAGFLALAGTALLSSCTPQQDSLAVINYSEMSVCATNNANGGPIDRIVLVFEITGISNKDANAVSFNFDPSQLYVSGGNGNDYAQTSPGDPSGLSLAGAPFGFAHTGAVPAGSTTTVNGGVAVTDITGVNSPDLTNMNTTDFRLLYATPAGSEGVVLVKANGNASGYPTVKSWGCPNNL
jgi:hypothetical protein